MTLVTAPATPGIPRGSGPAAWRSAGGVRPVPRAPRPAAPLPQRDRRRDILRIPKRRKIKPGRGNRPGGRP